MASIKKFEDLICWQHARKLANFIFDITDAKEFKDIDLKRQIRRAAISPMSNIAEGFDRGTRNEFVDALYIAKGEAGEVRAQLYISWDRKYIDAKQLEAGMSLTDSCSRLIQSFAEKVKGASKRGIQFKTVVPPDPMKEIMKEHSPEMYEKFYGNKK